uniref:ATP synthase epsilon chain, chloroplastic n=1 Tax=Bulboplastis apyrenoidosa TaxID=1070855 RepID=A0A1Y9TMD5_9RHOD|nr:ATP synthase CF1 subunit epsilon [Bulboplastis apyrenoidosa]ARO90838.1 ATP synthase CF1 subunit epsilon [Bulboplastis apyrenoidosa]
MLNLRVIAPDRTVWDASVEEIILPSSTGQLGILTNHAPLLTALDVGVMRIRIDKEWIPIVLMGGFSEIENNNVQILVNGAEKVTELDEKKVQEQLESALEMLKSVKTNKQKIEVSQQIRKARARAQALTMAA